MYFIVRCSMPSTVSYFNPLSQEHHAYRESLGLSQPKQALLWAVSILAGLLSLGVGGVAVFRLLSERFSKEMPSKQDPNFTDNIHKTGLSILSSGSDSDKAKTDPETHVKKRQEIIDKAWDIKLTESESEWLKQNEDITGNDEELKTYVQEWCMYRKELPDDAPLGLILTWARDGDLKVHPSKFVSKLDSSEFDESDKQIANKLGFKCLDIFQWLKTAKVIHEEGHSKVQKSKKLIDDISSILTTPKEHQQFLNLIKKLEAVYNKNEAVPNDAEKINVKTRFKALTFTMQQRFDSEERPIRQAERQMIIDKMTDLRISKPERDFLVQSDGVSEGFKDFESYVRGWCQHREKYPQENMLGLVLNWVRDGNLNSIDRGFKSIMGINPFETSRLGWLTGSRAFDKSQQEVVKKVNVTWIDIFQWLKTAPVEKENEKLKVEIPGMRVNNFPEILLRTLTTKEEQRTFLQILNKIAAAHKENKNFPSIEEKERVQARLSVLQNLMAQKFGISSS